MPAVAMLAALAVANVALVGALWLLTREHARAV
jgi:hypothetical protein